MEAAIQWFYVHGEHVEGPLTPEAFNALQADGVIYQHTLVIQAGMLDWLPLSDLMKTRQMIPTAGAAPLDGPSGCDVRGGGP